MSRTTKIAPHCESGTPLTPRSRRRPLLLNAVVLAALFVVFGASASAATLCVEPSGAGGCHTTIQAAVNAAAPGDTIEVAAGIYAEVVTVNKQLTLLGAQDGVDAKTRTAVPESVVSGGFGVTASGVRLDGFTVQDSPAAPYGTGIYLAAATSGHRVVNNIVKNNIFGLYLNSNGAARTVVRNNFFQTNNNPGAASGDAIYTDAGSHNVLVEANKFNGHVSAAMVFAGTQSNISVINNVLDDDSSIVFFNTTSAIVTGNTSTSPNGTGIYMGGGNNGFTITCNTVEQGSSNAILFTDNVGAPNQNARVNFNNLSGNLRGLRVTSAAVYTGTLNAEDNWWGDASGPGGAGPGTGNPILDPDGVADFTPFEAAPVVCSAIESTPVDREGWTSLSQRTATGNYVEGPGTPPLGTGSYRMTTGAGNSGPDLPGGGAGTGGKTWLSTQRHDFTRLADITAMGYSTYVSPSSAAADHLTASVQFQVDLNGDGTRDSTMVFEPVYSPEQATVAKGVWQTWNMKAGKWWFTNGAAQTISGSPTFCSQSCFVAFDTIAAAFPNAKIVTWFAQRADGYGVQIVGGQNSAGPPWTNFDGNVDGFNLSVAGNSTGYDFEFVPNADLAVDKTTTVDPARENQIFGYNVTVTNNGPSDQTGVTLVDTLPAGPSFVSATTSQGVCVHSSGTVTCNIGTVTSGSTVDILIKVKPRATGTLTNTATVSGDVVDANPDNNSKTINTEVIPHVDLKLTKSDSNDPVMLGDNTTYTLNVTNNGLSATATGVVITDTLPAGMEFVSSSDCTHSAGTVTCNVGSLAKGASDSVSFVAKATAGGVQTNTATATSDAADKDTSDNTATHNTTVIFLSKLSLNPSTAQGSCENSTGTVTLSGAAPAGGVTINLASSHASASVPPTVFVPGGATSAQFTITTSAVGSNKAVDITASRNTTSITKVLNVIKVGVDDLTLSTNTIQSGNSLTGTVTLKCAAAPGSVFVKLTSSNTGVAQVPASVTIPAGATSANFNITTTNPGTTTIKAAVSGSTSSSEVLTVTP